MIRDTYTFFLPFFLGSCSFKSLYVWSLRREAEVVVVVVGDVFDTLDFVLSMLSAEAAHSSPSVPQSVLRCNLRFRQRTRNNNMTTMSRSYRVSSSCMSFVDNVNDGIDDGGTHPLTLTSLSIGLLHPPLSLRNRPQLLVYTLKDISLPVSACLPVCVTPFTSAPLG